MADSRDHLEAVEAAKAEAEGGGAGPEPDAPASVDEILEAFAEGLGKSWDRGYETAIKAVEEMPDDWPATHVAVALRLALDKLKAKEAAGDAS